MRNEQMRWMGIVTVVVFAGTMCGTLRAQRTASPQSVVPFNLKSDHPGKIAFLGSKTAVLFTKEIDASFKGVLARDFVSMPGGKFPPGFLNASPAGQPWYGTMWTRDAGTFMRELVFWGYYAHACQVAQCVMHFVGKNRHGFIAFPRYFSPKKGRQNGTEMDGQASTIIAMVALWQRLPPQDPFRARIFHFLNQKSSPMRGIAYFLKHGPLVPGSGEFGGGNHNAYNVVQNNLCALAFISAANMDDQAGDHATAIRWRKDATILFHRITKYLINKKGSWIWNINPQTLKPNKTDTDSATNSGTGGLNGVVSMSADVLGFNPATWPWQGAYVNGRKTFEAMYNFPPRKKQFNKYGIWPQMNYIHKGLLTSPSYGQGYALQDMLLLDKLAMAGHGLHFLAWTTFKSPHEIFSFRKWHYGRLSPYYFYERLYSPDAYGKILMTAGCGPLNLVNVSEPLKVARLIAGVDDTSLKVVRIIPHLPPTWTGYRMKNWPMLTSHGVVRADISLARKDGVVKFALHVIQGGTIPRLTVWLPGKQRTTGIYRDHFENVKNLEFTAVSP